MEIRIEKPFRLHLEVVETEEHIPSMRMQAAIEVQQFGHKLEYHGSLWFDCSVWTAFASGLSGIDTADASLVDMSDHFALRLSAVSGRREIAWEFRKTDVTGAVSTAAFKSPIDEDTLAHVKHQFEQFEPWW